MTNFRERKILNSIEKETEEFFQENSSTLNNDSSWSFFPLPNELELKGDFFTAGVFIGEEDYCVPTVMDKVGNGRRNPKLPGGMTQKVIFHDNSYFAAVRSALEGCKTFDENGRETSVYSEPVVLEIVAMEKRRDKMNNKFRISKRNVVLEFIEEIGCYPVGMELCWYQHQKIKNWHRFFFWVKQLYYEKNGELVLMKNFEPIKGFKSTDQEIAFSLSLKFDHALKDQEKENLSEVLFPPHTDGLRTAGYLKCVEDRKFAFLYDSYCFNPYPFWDKKNPQK